MNNYKKAANAAIFVSLLSMIVVDFGLVFLLAFVDLGEALINIIYTPVVQIICMGVIPLLVFKLVSKAGKAEIKDVISFKPLGNKTALIVFAGMGMFVLNILVANWWQGYLAGIGYVEPESQWQTMNGIDLVINILTIALLPAIFEEFTFRGLFMGAYKNEPVKAVFLSAMAFALMHTDITQLGFTFVGGLVMGLFVIQTGSLLAGSIVHFCINAFSIIFAFLSQFEGTVFAYVTNILTTLFLVFSIVTTILIIMYGAQAFRNKKPREATAGKLSTSLVLYVIISAGLTLLIAVLTMLNTNA